MHKNIIDEWMEKKGERMASSLRFVADSIENAQNTSFAYVMLGEVVKGVAVILLAHEALLTKEERAIYEREKEKIEQGETHREQ